MREDPELDNVDFIRARLGEEAVIVILSMDKEANKKRVSDRHGGLQNMVDELMVS